jgi:hypothetical protein
MGAGNVRRDGNVEFAAIDGAGLDKIAVVLQCLDNQWVPRALLRRMLEGNKSLEDVAGERLQYVRSEYLRALVNARQIVVNRAFLYNSPAISRDLVSGGENHEAFRRLLDAGVVAPFLLNETSPIDRPRFKVDERGFDAWKRMCQEARPRCVRLSWDDAENASVMTEALTQRFRTFAVSMSELNVPTFCRELGLGAQDARRLERRLAEVTARCAAERLEGREITREFLYSQFVVTDDTPTPLGRYDRHKPFSGEIKQLLDLRYNTNLPDALERYPLIPIDSMQRTALQEYRPAANAQPMSARELAHRIKDTVFQQTQGGLYIKSLGDLSLAELEKVRGTEAWNAYISSMENLVANPLTFPDPDRGAAAVYHSYIDLARVVTRLAQQRRVQTTIDQWVPVVEIVVEVAGAVLSVIPSLLDKDAAVACQVAGRVSEAIGKRAAPVVVRLVVRGLTERGSRAELATSIDLIKGKLDSAQEQWAELLAAFQKSPVYEDTARLRAQELGNMDGPEADG